MKRVIASLALVLLLAACQETLDAHVTRFNNLPASPSGQSFTILPDKGQAGGLEFQHYAELVANALQGYGLRPIPHEGPPADLVVMLHYGNAGARTDYYYDPGPYWGGWGYPWGWGGGGYYGGDVTTYTTYSQYLDVEIFDGPAWRSNQRRMVFEGRAVGDSSIRDLNLAMPYLVNALFQNFPGVSGQTVKVSVPIYSK